MPGTSPPGNVICFNNGSNSLPLGGSGGIRSLPYTDVPRISMLRQTLPDNIPAGGSGEGQAAGANVIGEPSAAGR